MSKERYTINKLAQLILEVDGDLSVMGGDLLDVTVRGAHESSESEKGLTLRAAGSLDVRVPATVSLTIAHASGDVLVKGVEGDVVVKDVSGDLVLKRAGNPHIQHVGGDLVVRDSQGAVIVEQVMGDAAFRSVANLEIEAVHGDLAVRYVEGNLSVNKVMGDISVRSVTGDVAIQSGMRDVNLKNLGGKVQVAQAEGDIRLRGGLPSGKHSFNAAGDIVVRWPVDVPVNLEVTASQIRNRLPLEQVVEEEGHLSGRLGEGETTLVLEAAGRVILKAIESSQWDTEWDVEAEWSGFGEEIMPELAGLGAQITSQLNQQMAELSSRMEQHLSGDVAQRMADKAARKAEKAVKRAVRQMERVQQRAGPWTPPAPQAASRSQKESKISAEEQMKILNMLENGVLSVEEADTLLKALDNA